MTRLLLLLSLFFVAACSDPAEDPSGGDASVDVVADLGIDQSEADTATDTGLDVTVDTSADGAEDPAPDVRPDSVADTTVDTTADTPDDTASDATDDGAADVDTDGGDTERPLSEHYGQIIFNEVLMDGTAEGDPNGDGDPDPVGDQFVELVNVGGVVIDMSGFTLIERHLSGLPRHTFADAFALEAEAGVVVFGGGDAPDPTESATFFVANAADSGLQFGLHLFQEGDEMLLLDDQGAIVARFCYGLPDEQCELEAAADASLTRVPDLTGDFVSHAGAEGAGEAVFSPGTRVDGSAF